MKTSSVPPLLEADLSLQCSPFGYCDSRILVADTFADLVTKMFTKAEDLLSQNESLINLFKNEQQAQWFTSITVSMTWEDGTKAVTLISTGRPTRTKSDGIGTMNRAGKLLISKLDRVLKAQEQKEWHLSLLGNLERLDIIANARNTSQPSAPFMGLNLEETLECLSKILNIYKLQDGANIRKNLYQYFEKSEKTSKVFRKAIDALESS